MAGKQKTFTFNSTVSSTYGVYAGGDATFTTPEREYERISIDGMSGDLLYDKGRYTNTSMTYRCGIVSNFVTNYNALRAFLMSQVGYKRLEDDFHTGEYRMARFTGNISPEIRQHYAAGTFTLTFDCMPQRWLTSGESATTFSADGTITNPTLYPAKPLLRIYGDGAVGVGSETITVSAHSYTYIDVDCEIMDAFYGSTNCNQYVTFTGVPTLEAGSNGITLGTGITKVEVTPRWWTL